MGHSIVIVKATTINQRCNDIVNAFPSSLYVTKYVTLERAHPQRCLRLPPLRSRPSLLLRNMQKDTPSFSARRQHRLQYAGYHEALAGCQSRRCGVEGHCFCTKRWAGLQRCARLRAGLLKCVYIKQSYVPPLKTPVRPGIYFCASDTYSYLRTVYVQAMQ